VGEGVDDGFGSYYTERLWQLLPGLYRAADSSSLSADGPLHELLARIGEQVAVLRRSIDRLWENQSIETCEPFAIPYLGDLLGTNLVQLDVRGQRLDVFNTIYYRQRKGTVPLLEQLAADVTGWTAHVVEGFRRLARSRHGLDPPLGAAAFPGATSAEVDSLLASEQLRGLLSGGPAGGLADLRNAHGAALAGGPFEEAFHSADLRLGQGALGHYGIQKLLVFLWRLTSFSLSGVTPVAVAGCPGQYTFDPTGREVPLFLPEANLDNGGTWTPALEWQVPGPLTTSLLDAVLGSGATPPPPGWPPYPGAASIPPFFGVSGVSGGAGATRVWPEIGRCAVEGPSPEALSVSYSYGFPSMLGAGPYDRDLVRSAPQVAGAEQQVSGGSGLDRALGSAGPTGTVTLGDSATYPALAGVGSSAAPIASLLVRAGPGCRPVLLPSSGQEWVLTGGTTDGAAAEVVLDGLLLSGCDLVLRGAFASVRITACTFDPGTAAAPGTVPAGSPPLATSASGGPLAPTRIFVEADPAATPGSPSVLVQLTIERSVLGPVRTRFGGSVETLTISDSIVQGLPATSGTAFGAADVFDPVLLAGGLLAKAQPADDLRTALGATAQGATALGALEAYATAPLSVQSGGLPAELLDGLNALVSGPSLWDATRFDSVGLSPDVLALAQSSTVAPLDAAYLAALNCALIEQSFPVALGVAGLAVADACVQLARVSVLGRMALHRLAASDSILHDFAVVDDTQDGCVRFSGLASGSYLPRQYECATFAPQAALFTSDAYGQPGYAQLLDTADRAVAGGGSVSSGAENGSEMGAYCADLNPVKEQGLLVKYEEFLPLGLSPVVVHVT